MAATVWFPGYSLNATAEFIEQVFTATAGQTAFILTDFVYTLGGAAIKVFINGQLQTYNVDYTEVSPTAIALIEGADLGDEVKIIAIA